MKFRLTVAAAAAICAIAGTSAQATVVANTLPYSGTPDWSDVTFPGASMVPDGATSLLNTYPGLAVWFGWLGSDNPPGWSIADNSAGNYLSLTARFSAGSADWNAYMTDDAHYIEMRFNPTPCDNQVQNCYLFSGAQGVNLYFAGDLPGTARTQFVALDTTQYNHFEWLLLGSSVTYRINGQSYTDTAIPYSGQKLLIIGDASGTSLSGAGQMRISGVSFDAGTAFTSLPTTVPEPASWAMLIAGFGLVGAALRRRRAVFA